MYFYSIMSIDDLLVINLLAENIAVVDEQGSVAFIKNL